LIAVVTHQEAHHARRDSPAAAPTANRATVPMLCIFAQYWYKKYTTPLTYVNNVTHDNTVTFDTQRRSFRR